jgi:hypothetical protein
MRTKVEIAPLGRGLSITVSLFLLIMTYFGYAAIREGLRDQREKAALARDGVKTAGTVIDHTTGGRTGSSNQTYYSPVVSYRVGSREFRRYTNIRNNHSRQRPVGSTLEVVYLPRDPAIARVVIDNKDRWSSLVMIGIAMILVAIALAFAGVKSGILFGTRSVILYDKNARQHRRSASRSR